MSKLSTYEQENGIVLPIAYKEFYDRCASNLPVSLVGTDLANNNPGLRKLAVELLQENRVDNFLDEKDFVFIMHQGYIFWFFRADGDPDPDVYGFSEVDLEKKYVGKLIGFLEEYY